MREMTREDLGVFLDATQKVCSFCDALHCDTCQVPNLVTKYKNTVSDKEKAYAEAEAAEQRARAEALKVSHFLMPLQMLQTCLFVSAVTLLRQALP